MSPADLERLEVAKRAYQTTQASAAEVQTGVRRARLWLGRPKSRRNWFSRGLVLVVLALGSLAYAKPQALGELVKNTIQPTPPLPAKLRRGSGSSEPPSVVADTSSIRTKPSKLVQTQASKLVTEPSKLAVAEPPSAGTNPPSTSEQPLVGTSQVAERPSPNPARQGAMRSGDVARREASASSVGERGREPSAVSDWGRVGRALAAGDDGAAISTLEQLAESDDPSTRDKADLGRAQLFMAHGNAERACELARSLAARHPGKRIERQALVLLKSCTR